MTGAGDATFNGGIDSAAGLFRTLHLQSDMGGDLGQRSYERVAARQKDDGSFIYSKGDHGFLRDSRSYPRPMAMTLFHLLYGAGLGDGFAKA